LRPMPAEIDHATLERIRSDCRSREAAFGLTMLYPGFHSWYDYVEGGLGPLAYAEADEPDILREWFEYDLERGDRELDLVLAMEPEYLLFGGSGTITLASPALARKYAIPALARWSRKAKRAGIPSMLHCCGKSRVLVDMLAEETDIVCINPLEVPPQGDVDLAEVKRSRGSRICLMGNLHTSAVMLRGSAADVERESLKAMRDAGERGGFILSSGDQCGRETPEENIFAMVRTARERGRYDRSTGRLPDLDRPGG
jgi:uroporphyrinogen decarboxylase